MLAAFHGQDVIEVVDVLPVELFSSQDISETFHYSPDPCCIVMLMAQMMSG